ncbi:replication terminator protein [Paenibacillus sp. Marseille-P2973]|uniref:replication terminator protein n=1 Tax=Paenibacillus sp. Marseille-P2973 TaxID=1871032 RepID=UPI001B365CAC|nr:replication terminator protein [Paenibacillus sp. Marseille-P2973]MBQ4899332.1 replication terminator protein [Paenibacillus sp. Marseille-P2973]
MNINLNDLAEGAVGERFDLELQKVLDNIQDPNTDWKKARKLTLTLTIQPDETREIAVVGIDAKTTLAPARGLATKIIMGRDGRGQIVGAELKSGVKDQMMIDNDGDVADDRGQKVSYLQKKQKEAQGGN